MMNEKLLQNLIELLHNMPDSAVDGGKDEVVPEDAKGLEIMKVKALGKPDMNDDEDDGMQLEKTMSDADDEDMPLESAAQVMKGLKNKKMMAGG